MQGALALGCALGVLACEPDGDPSPVSHHDDAGRVLVRPDATPGSVSTSDAAVDPVEPDAETARPLDASQDSSAPRMDAAAPMSNGDAGAPDAAPEAGPATQELPAALRAAGVRSLFPAPNASDVCPDPPLRITFSGAPTLGNSGKIQLFELARPDQPVATLDMAKTTISASIDGLTFNVPRPAYVEGNSVVLIVPALSYGREYFVRIEAGAILGPNAASVATGDDRSFRFRTRAAAPADRTQLQVALDGTGAFCSLQGALDATPASGSTLSLGRGTYYGIAHVRSKQALTVRGADRKATILAGVNNENLNPGTAKRALIGVDDSRGVVFENLTIHNRTPQGGSQAEALRMQRCERCSVRDADIISLQDTLLWSGTVYAKNSFIAGNVDFIWGTGVAYFDRCEIKTLGRKGYTVQARNTGAAYGYVFVDSKLTSDPGITGHWLARIDSAVYPQSHVAYIDCEMGDHIDPAGFQVTGGGSSQLRFWEYRSKTPRGDLVDVGRRGGGARQLSAAEAAMMRAPSMVLGGWTPE